MIEFLSPHARSQELEQIGHEEDGLNVLRALEAEGWMKVLFPAWTSAKADEEKLKALHELAVALLLQGVHADMSAAQMQLLTAKLPSKDLAALKKSCCGRDSWRSGTAWMRWRRVSKGAAVEGKCRSLRPATSCLRAMIPKRCCGLDLRARALPCRNAINQFLKVWPESRQGIPHALMQEMRITPELAGYTDLVHAIFLELIDGKLTTPEEMRAYLEPHSPPAPPPQVTIKRPRVKRCRKIKEQTFRRRRREQRMRWRRRRPGRHGGDDDEVDLA